MNLKEALKSLADAFGPSGSERAASEAAAGLLRPFADEIKIDAYGNVIGKKFCGLKNAPTLLLDAHLDQIGFMVTEVTDDGFIRFAGVGGLDQRVLPGSNLLIQTQRHGKIPGVIATIPPHLLILMETGKATDIEDLVIDVGMEASQIKEKIQPGDFAYYAEEAFEMKENLLCGKAMDDRACFVCIVRALELLAGKRLNCDIVVTGTGKEEIGFRGAITTGYRNLSDLAIAVDVCHAKTGDTQIGDNVYDFGGGPVIAFGSNSMPSVARTLVKTAKDAGIPYQLSATPGYSGTNAWAYQHSGDGMRVAILLLPLKYMHTPVEMLCVEDVENLSRLLAEFVLHFPGTAEGIK